MEHNNDYHQFDQIIEENEMTGLGNNVVIERLRHAEAAANNLFGILGILANRAGGKLEFSEDEWNAKLPFESVTYGEDYETGKVVIEFHE